MLNYHNNQLIFSNYNLQDIAQQFSTPTYVYSEDIIKSNYQQYTDTALATTNIHYAVKANSNLSILKLLHNLGAGFDIVSIGELQRVITATNSSKKVIFSGVGKTASEIEYALKVGILCFNVESIAELHLIQKVAQKIDKIAPISLRINPDVDAKTHAYISTGLKNNKFGIAFNQAIETYKLAATMPNINIIGIDCHIGSQILDISPFFAALDKLLELVKTLQNNGINLKHLDLGGGIGVNYYNSEENATKMPDISAYVEKVQNHIKNSAFPHLELIFEPGRSIIANAGVLITKVLFLKQGESKNFCIVDAAMNDLARPAMYQAFHAVQSINQNTSQNMQCYDIVGPVCESGDWLAKDVHLNLNAENLDQEYLAILSAGSYGFTMSSNYNTRTRAAEVLINSSNNVKLIRARENLEDLWQHELTYL